MKFRVIAVEKVDIVERILLLIVEELDPIVVDKLDSASFVASKLSPDAVDKLETDNFRVEKLEPATVDKKFTF